MADILFSTFGAPNKKSLDLKKNAIVYQSSRKFALNRSNPDQRPSSSEWIPAGFTAKIEQIRGRFLLNQYKEQYRNINVYSGDAVTIDGLNRLCYLEYVDKADALRVSEIGNKRNSGYSALYREFARMLEGHGFKQTQNAFLIRGDQLDQFVALANQLIDDKEKGLLVLKPVPEIDVMTFTGLNKHAQEYYYYKAYWVRKGEEASCEEPPSPTMTKIPNEGDAFFHDIEQAIRAYAEYSLSNNNADICMAIQERVEEIRRKLDILDKLNDAKLTALKSLEEI